MQERRKGKVCVRSYPCPPKPSHQSWVQVEGSGEENHSCLPVLLLQASLASVVTVDREEQAEGLALTLHQPTAYSWGQDCGS